MLRLCSILVPFILAFQIQSQVYTPPCATDGQAVKQQMLANRLEIPQIASLRNEIKYVPIRVHAIANNDGSDGILPHEVTEMMCVLNQNFANQNIQFYLKRIDYNVIHNSTLNLNPTSNFNTLRFERVLDAINIFFPTTISSQTAGVYYGPARENDWILIGKQFISDIRITTHEVGHYFSVPHPFHGWDNDPWDPDKHGNPVGVLAPDRRTINEFADGSNCDSTLSQNQNNVGDGICDTPADYNFAEGGCSYTKNAMDPTGQPVSPLRQNFMNYFWRCSDYTFTNGQKKEILRSFNSSSRSYLDVESFATFQEITESPRNLVPANGTEVDNSSGITLSWDPVEGATHYLVEIDLLPTFGDPIDSRIVTATQLTLFELENGRNYFWRVQGLNKYSFCAPKSNPNRLKTSATTSVEDLESAKGWRVFPNPITAGSGVSMSFAAEESFTADLEIYAIGGRRIFSWREILILPGNGTIDLPITLDRSGVYLVRLITPDGQATKKLLVY